MIKLYNRFNQLYYEAHYDEANKWVTTRYEGFCRPEDIIEGVKSTLKLIEETPATKLLSDNRGLKGTWSEANDWLEENWYKLAPQYGLKTHATVLSADLFYQISQESHEKANVNTGITMKSFEGLEEAKKWLQPY